MRSSGARLYMYNATTDTLITVEQLAHTRARVLIFCSRGFGAARTRCNRSMRGAVVVVCEARAVITVHRSITGSMHRARFRVCVGARAERQFCVWFESAAAGKVERVARARRAIVALQLRAGGVVGRLLANGAGELFCLKRVG